MPDGSHFADWTLDTPFTIGKHAGRLSRCITRHTWRLVKDGFSAFDVPRPVLVPVWARIEMSRIMLNNHGGMLFGGGTKKSFNHFKVQTTRGIVTIKEEKILPAWRTARKWLKRPKNAKDEDTGTRALCQETQLAVPNWTWYVGRESWRFLASVRRTLNYQFFRLRAQQVSR